MGGRRSPLQPRVAMRELGPCAQTLRRRRQDSLRASGFQQHCLPFSGRECVLLAPTEVVSGGGGGGEGGMGWGAWEREALAFFPKTSLRHLMQSS